MMILKMMVQNMMIMSVFLIMIKKNQVFYYSIIKDLKILISTYNKMKKQKQKLVLNISEVSSDDEFQAKPHHEDLKKYIKDSDDE